MADDDSNNALSCKVVLLGESGVGKTSIISRYTTNTFSSILMSTTGASFATKTMMLEDENQSVKFEIWDTAGQERFRNITNQYYKGADGIVLVFDLTDRKSFDKTREWMAQIKANTRSEEIAVVLLGNKCDAEPKVIQNNEAIALGEELGHIKYFQTSASQNIGIIESFEYLAREILNKKNIDLNKKDTPQGKGMNISNGGKTPKQKKECCG